MILNESFPGVYDGKNVEKDLKRYVNDFFDITGKDYFYIPNKIKHQRVKIPAGYNILPRKFDKNGDRTAYSRLPESDRNKVFEFWTDQKKKINEGVIGMSGLQYLYYNFYKDKAARGPMKWRRHDNEVHSYCEAGLYGEGQYSSIVNKGTGVLFLGRRREGKSNKMGNTVLHLCIREKNALVILGSKTEKDAKMVLVQDKVQYALDGFPVALKPDILKSSTGEIYMAKSDKDEAGNLIKTGKNNRIIALAPTVTAVEGKTVRMFLHDEAPKTDHLVPYVENTLPALNDEEGFLREGFALIGGVAGDFEKHGDGFITLWKRAHEDNFIRFFSPGWSGLHCDEYGNEDVEKALRMILESRHKIMSNKKTSLAEREKQLRNAQQRFPLTEEEALMSSEGGMLDGKIIDEQERFLEKLDYNVFRCSMTMGVGKTPVMTPDSAGKVHYIEPPIPGQKYIGGVDCYGLKRDEKTGSVGAGVIYKLENEELSPLEKEDIIARVREIQMTPKQLFESILKLGDLPVAFYTASPKSPSTFAGNMALLANWYSNGAKMEDPLKLNVEREPPLIYDHLSKEFASNLAITPFKAGQKITKADYFKYGIDMKEYWAEMRRNYLIWYVNNKMRGMLFPFMFKPMKVYNDQIQKKKDDNIDALGLALILRDQEWVKKWNKNKNIKTSKSKIGFSYRRSGS